MKRKTIRSLAGTTVATAACVAAGAVASDPDSSYYRSLDKPEWNPPNVVFPVVWTSLYADIAATSGIALADLDGDEARTYRRALGANLVLNAGWSFAFFRWRKRGLATVWAAALAASSADLVRRTARVNKAAGVALAPYALWTSFATLLSGSIWRRNRRRAD